MTPKQTLSVSLAHLRALPRPHPGANIRKTKESLSRARKCRRTKTTMSSATKELQGKAKYHEYQDSSDYPGRSTVHLFGFWIKHPRLILNQRSARTLHRLSEVRHLGSQDHQALTIWKLLLVGEAVFPVFFAGLMKVPTMAPLPDT